MLDRAIHISTGVTIQIGRSDKDQQDIDVAQLCPTSTQKKSPWPIPDEYYVCQDNTPVSQIKHTSYLEKVAYFLNSNLSIEGCQRQEEYILDTPNS